VEGEPAPDRPLPRRLAAGQSGREGDRRRLLPLHALHGRAGQGPLLGGRLAVRPPAADRRLRRSGLDQPAPSPRIHRDLALRAERRGGRFPGASRPERISRSSRPRWTSTAAGPSAADGSAT
jgi:hypothetical protein